MMDNGQDQGYGAMFGNWLKNSGFLDSTDTASGIKTQGWGAPALGAAEGLANSYLAFQQYGLAKDTLNENRRQFQLNFDQQKALTDRSIQRQDTALASANPNNYSSLEDYYSRNGNGRVPNFDIGHGGK